MGATFVCAACGRKKETDWPITHFAVELAAWALDAGWKPLWGADRVGSFVRLFCSARCAEANITKKGTLRKRPVRVERDPKP